MFHRCNHYSDKLCVITVFTLQNLFEYNFQNPYPKLLHSTVTFAKVNKLAFISQLVIHFVNSEDKHFFICDVFWVEQNKNIFDIRWIWQAPSMFINVLYLSVLFPNYPQVKDTLDFNRNKSNRVHQYYPTSITSISLYCQ